jgi:hypothetical protein
MYDYRDSRELIRLMQRAQRALEEQGPEAFRLFRENPDDWQYKEAYLYVYNTNGLCLFHGGIPELEGQTITNLTDATGRPMLALSLNSARDPYNPHGWIHYWWNPPNRIYPAWKSSCNKIITMANGESVMVGTGLDNHPRERIFIKIAVDSAVRLIEEKGFAALETLRDPDTRYNLPGSSLFVVTETGDTLIAPGFQTDQARNILDYEDDAGHTPLRSVIEHLQNQEQTWEILLTRDPLSMNMHKKGLYARKAMLNGQTIYIAATADLPKPSWMK